MLARATVICKFDEMGDLLLKLLLHMAVRSVPSFLIFLPFAAKNVDATTLDHEDRGHGRAVSSENLEEQGIIPALYRIFKLIYVREN